MHTRKITLPSGRTIEQVYHQDHATPEPDAGRRWSAPALAICPACDSELVHPADWWEHDSTTWELILRCPDCETFQAGIFATQVEANAYDEHLDRGTEALLGDLKRLTRANMEAEADALAAALAVDAILPMDF